MKAKRKNPELEAILEGCLAAFVAAGTMELSLDQLSAHVGVSKRMLIHYFGGREQIEEGAVLLLENRLRLQFSPAAFPRGTKLPRVVDALWAQTTDPASRGVLLVVMDLTRRAWCGSERAQAFYAEQQRLWVELLERYVTRRHLVEELLQLFQGAVLAFLITGDPEPGRRALHGFLVSKNLAGRKTSTRSSKTRR